MADDSTPQLDLIGSAEAATLCSVHVATIARWAADGTLPIAARLTGKTNPLLFHRTDVERVAAERTATAEAGRVDLELVLAVLAVVAAFTIGLNFVGPHFQTAVLVLASSIGALCFYLGVLVTVPKAMPQPRRVGVDRGRRDRVVEQPIRLGRGHCCACSVVCHHIGPVSLCAGHQTTAVTR